MSISAASAGLLAVGLVVVAPQAALAAPAAPTVRFAETYGNGPSGPTQAFLDPTFGGTAAPSSTVRLYGNSACTGTPLGKTTASSGPQGDWYIRITVKTGSTTRAHATATDGSGTSACSTTSVKYRVPPRPNTRITKKPKKTVKYRDGYGAEVKFRYTSTTGGKTFSCWLNGKPLHWSLCQSGRILTLKKGNYTFKVAAHHSKLTQLVDKSPAKYKFKVKKKKRR